MPLYEYRCSKCQRTVEEIRPMAESSEPIRHPCIDSPGEGSEVIDCEFDRILSPTPTTFRFNDFNGYAGLEKTRSMWKKPDSK